MFSYDLSDIAYEEWEDIDLLIDGELDLSETKGNFDFNIINLRESPFSEKEPNLIIKGCNVKNLKKINQVFESYYSNKISLKKENFDENIINENKEAFYLDDFTDNIRRLITRNYNFSLNELSEEDLFSLSNEDIEILKTHPFFDMFIDQATNDDFDNKNGIIVFFNKGVGKDIFWNLLEYNKDALRYILDHFSHSTYFYEQLTDSNGNLNTFINKVKEDINNDIFNLIELNLDKMDKREELIKNIDNLKNIDLFGYKELFRHLPSELIEKLDQRELDLDDFIKYSKELNNPFFLLYTKDEKIIERMQEHKYDTLNKNRTNLEVIYENFITKCANIEKIMKNNFKINKLYALVNGQYQTEIYTKEQLLIGDNYIQHFTDKLLNMSEVSVDKLTQFIIEKKNNNNDFIVNNCSYLINSFLNDIFYNNTKFNNEDTEKIISFIDIISKNILSIILKSNNIDNIINKDFEKKVQLISSLKISNKYESAYDQIFTKILVNLDINDKEKLENFKSLINFINKMSKYDMFNKSIDFYIYNIIKQGDILSDTIKNSNNNFEKYIDYIISKNNNVSSVMDEVLKTEINKDYNFNSLIKMDYSKYNKMSSIFTKINSSSERQSIIIKKYFNTRFNDKIDSNELSSRDEKFILLINELSKKLQSVSLSTNNVVNDFIIENMNNESIYSKRFDEKIDFLIDLCIRADYSNSSELRRISTNVIKQLIDFPKEEAYKKFDLIEQVFLKNNLPYFAKLYNVFEILNPNIPSGASPNLNARKNDTNRKIIIFSDLLLASIKSNDKNFIDYINNIKEGNEILKLLISGNLNLNDLEKEDMSREKEVFNIFINHLNTLYNNTQEGKKHPNELKENYIKDAYELLSLFLKNEKENFNVDELPDRIVRMFGHFAGIDTIEQLEKMIKESVITTNERNRLLSQKGDVTLKKGDLIKGLNSIKFLQNTLEHGILCKEFLGSAAGSDATPMDADFSIILEDSTISKGLQKTAAQSYGPIWIILKNDERNRFNDTNNNTSFQKNKLELFNTGYLGSDHVGIRTGLGSTEIDYILIDELDLKNEIEQYIVMNGFYIPIVNMRGKVIFTYEEYEKRRKNMEGLTFYGMGNSYTFASELDDFDSSDYPYDINIGNNIIETTRKRNLIINALSKTGLNISNKRQYDMSNGVFELLDTGSTGRGTNSANDYDFDFIMRIDRDVYLDEDKYKDFQNKIIKAFPNISFIDKYTIRKQHINLEGQEVEIDITIIQKDDKIQYTTDECIRDRLDSLQKLDEEKYKKVLENIVLAKEVLKENDCYKPDRGDKPQGGLGGVGVENWILQHGGSFEAAARDFLDKSEGLDFSDFKAKYKVWDFGENHLYYKHSGSKYDEFVSNNMSQSGYEKMKTALKEYIEKIDKKRDTKNSNRQL